MLNPKSPLKVPLGSILPYFVNPTAFLRGHFTAYPSTIFSFYLYKCIFTYTQKVYFPSHINNVAKIMSKYVFITSWLNPQHVARKYFPAFLAIRLGACSWVVVNRNVSTSHMSLLVQELWLRMLSPWWLWFIPWLNGIIKWRQHEFQVPTWKKVTPKSQLTHTGPWCEQET